MGPRELYRVPGDPEELAAFPLAAIYTSLLHDPEFTSEISSETPSQCP